MANDDSVQLHPLQLITLRMLSERSSRGEQQEIAEMMADLERALVEPQGQPAWKVGLAQIQQHIGCALTVAHYVLDVCACSLYESATIVCANTWVQRWTTVKVGLVTQHCL